MIRLIPRLRTFWCSLYFVFPGSSMFICLNIDDYNDQIIFILQVGAAFARPTESALQVTRVPAGLAAYAPLDVRAIDQPLYAIGTLTDIDASGSVFSQYELGSRNSAAVKIGDMEFRPVEKSHSSNNGVAAFEKPMASAMYSTVWQVQDSDAIISRPRQLRRYSPALQTDQGSVKLPNSHLLTQAVLRALQTAASKHVTLMTSGLFIETPEYIEGSAYLAEAVGLLRVAAQEFPSTSAHHIDATPSLKYFSGAEMQDADVFGLSRSCGRRHVPILVESEERGPNYGMKVAGHSVLVTGGLGDIGTLAGLWSALETPSDHVILTSRSGKANHLNLGSPGIDCQLTAVASNASCDSDMHGLQDYISRQASDNAPQKNSCCLVSTCGPCIWGRLLKMHAVDHLFMISTVLSQCSGFQQMRWICNAHFRTMLSRYRVWEFIQIWPFEKLLSHLRSGSAHRLHK